MTRFIAKRLAAGLVALVVVSALVFMGTNLLPGNPATAILGKDATPARVAALSQELGLNKPAVTRYLDWLGGAVHGDFGRSVTQGVGTLSGSGGTKVSALIGPALVNSLILASISLGLVFVGSFLIGTGAAMRRNSPEDRVIQVVMLLFLALPEFVLGALLIIVFAFTWPVLPAVTLTPSAQGLVLPVATLVLGALGWTARLIRVSVSEILDTNYVANARLRGVPEARVIRSYVLPNSIAPVAQAFAMMTGAFLGEIVVVEYLFGYPGIGTGFVNAVAGRDYPVIDTYTLIFAGAYILANSVAAVVTTMANPRLRVAVAER
jgi:peptide/nickel transport system permease protein